MGVTFKATIDGDRAVVSFSSDAAVAGDVEREPSDIDVPVGEAPARTVNKRKVVRRRFLKVALYTTLGVVLSVAGYLTLTLLTGFDLPAWLITVGTVVVSGFAGAIHKSIGWQEMGIEAPEVPDATVPPLTLPSAPTE